MKATTSTLFSLGLGRVLLVVQEHEAEEEDSQHHGERAHVVGVGGGDEPLILGVLQRPHRHLGKEDMWVKRETVAALSLVKVKLFCMKCLFRIEDSMAMVTKTFQIHSSRAVIAEW